MGKPTGNGEDFNLISEWNGKSLDFGPVFLTTGLRIDYRGAFSCRRSKESGYKKTTGVNEGRGDGGLDQDCVMGKFAQHEEGSLEE